MTNLEALNILGNPIKYYNTKEWMDAMWTMRRLIEKDKLETSMHSPEHRYYHPNNEKKLEAKNHVWLSLTNDGLVEDVKPIKKKRASKMPNEDDIQWLKQIGCDLYKLDIPYSLILACMRAGLPNMAILRKNIDKMSPVIGSENHVKRFGIVYINTLKNALKEYDNGKQGLQTIEF